MKQAEFTIIHAPEFMDKFMKAADLFHHKNLGTVQTTTISYREEVELTLEYASRNMEHLREALSSTGQKVSFIHLDCVQNGNTITLNESILPYYDATVREISDGHKSFLFWQFIEKFTPFKCELDDRCFIKEISKH